MFLQSILKSGSKSDRHIEKKNFSSRKKEYNNLLIKDPSQIIHPYISKSSSCYPLTLFKALLITTGELNNQWIHKDRIYSIEKKIKNGIQVLTVDEIERQKLINLVAPKYYPLSLYNYTFLSKENLRFQHFARNIIDCSCIPISKKMQLLQNYPVSNHNFSLICTYFIDVEEQLASHYFTNYVPYLRKKNRLLNDSMNYLFDRRKNFRLIQKNE